MADGARGPILAFYISGHGFGHASRQVEIINAAGRVHPSSLVFIRSTVPRWLLDRTIHRPFVLDSQPCDTGVVQIDSLRLDAEATIAHAARFYSAFDERVGREARWLRDQGVDLVIADAPPLACAAAARAGIPVVVVANFTWDWIYESYADELVSAPWLVPLIKDAYRDATAAWRLPMHGGFDAIGRVIDVPLVARHARHAALDTRRRLELPIERPIALSSFGGFGVSDLNVMTLDCLSDWDVVVTGGMRPDRLPRGVHFFEEEEIYRRGLRYEDLVAAVTVVVTKPGYGIVSECVANRTAVVYTSRGEFAEYPILVAHIERWLKSAFIEQDDVLSGRWSDALERAASGPRPGIRPPANGAEVIADMMTALCSADAHSSGPPPPHSS